MAQQTYRAFCRSCDDATVVEQTVDLPVSPARRPALYDDFARCECGGRRIVYAIPQDGERFTADWKLTHPAAAAEAKAVCEQLEAGVEAADVTMIGREQWRKLPKPCGCRLNMTCDVCRPPTVVPVDPDPDAGLIGADQFRPPRGIPAHMHAALIGYVERGHPVGSFLAAVLANDFVQALTRCDDDNRAAIDEWVELLRGHMPNYAWGSREAVAAWQQRGGLKGGR